VVTGTRINCMAFLVNISGALASSVRVIGCASCRTMARNDSIVPVRGGPCNGFRYCPSIVSALKKHIRRSFGIRIISTATLVDVTILDSAGDFAAD
jgi:hypothetical protein